MKWVPGRKTEIIHWYFLVVVHKKTWGNTHLLGKEVLFFFAFYFGLNWIGLFSSSSSLLPACETTTRFRYNVVFDMIDLTFGDLDRV